MARRADWVRRTESRRHGNPYLVSGRTLASAEGRSPANDYRCRADSRRNTKCWHKSSAQVNRPAIPLSSAFAGAAQVQWPQVGFSIHVLAGEKYRHNSHRCSIIAGHPLSKSRHQPVATGRLQIHPRTSLLLHSSLFRVKSVLESTDVDAKMLRL